MLINMLKWSYPLLAVLAGIALLIVLWNMSQFSGNQALQGEVNARQQYINQTVSLNQLNNQIIRLLAARSAETGDEELKRLLAEQGVTFTYTPPATPSTPAVEEPKPSPAPPSKEKTSK